MSLATVVERAEQQRKLVTVYDGDGELFEDQLSTRNVTVVHRPLPPGVFEAFVAIRDGESFEAAIPLSDLREFLTPPIRRPGDFDDLSPEYRAIFTLFDDTVFASLDRRQLLATVRELEDRAWRTAEGELHVGFQSVVAFREQEPVYRRLAEETDLDVHVYTVPESSTDELSDPPITFHTEPIEDVGRFWFFAFDGGPDPSQNCAMVAEQRDGGSYYGFWTYDRPMVDRVFEELR